MPKAKPASLHPPTFHEALRAIVAVDPDSVGIARKRRKQRQRSNKSSAIQTSETARRDPDNMNLKSGIETTMLSIVVLVTIGVVWDRLL